MLSPDKPIVTKSYLGTWMKLNKRNTKMNEKHGVFFNYGNWMENEMKYHRIES